MMMTRDNKRSSVALLLVCVIVSVQGCARRRLDTDPDWQPYPHLQAAHDYAEPTTVLDAREPAAPAQVAIAVPRRQLLVGEKLKYSARWMGIPVGWGSVEIKEIIEYQGRQAYHVVGEAHSNEWLSTFYPLHDEVHSYIDIDNLHTLRFEKSQHEGNYRAEEVVTFDHAQGIATYESLWNREAKDFIGEAIKHVAIPAGIQDPLSVFYSLRLRPLTVGQSLFVDVYSDEKAYHMEVKILKSMRLELRRLGVFNAIKIEPIATFRGLLVRRGRVVVYLTADQARVPLAIYLWTPWGQVSGIIDRASLKTTHSTTRE